MVSVGFCFRPSGQETNRQTNKQKKGQTGRQKHANVLNIYLYKFMLRIVF